jgi:hypothetical protein
MIIWTLIAKFPSHKNHSLALCAKIVVVISTKHNFSCNTKFNFDSNTRFGICNFVVHLLQAILHEYYYKIWKELMGLGSPIDVLQLFPLHEIIDRFCHKNL